MSLASLCKTEIIVQKKATGTLDSMGGTTGTTYTDWISDVMVRIQPLTGKEKALYDQTITKVDTKIYLESISGSDLVAETCRIKYGARYYDIESVIDVDEQERMLMLECVELV